MGQAFEFIFLPVFMLNRILMLLSDGQLVTDFVSGQKKSSLELEIFGAFPSRELWLALLYLIYQQKKTLIKTCQLLIMDRLQNRAGEGFDVENSKFFSVGPSCRCAVEV